MIQEKQWHILERMKVEETEAKDEVGEENERKRGIKEGIQSLLRKKWTFKQCTNEMVQCIHETSARQWGL